MDLDNWSRFILLLPLVWAVQFLFMYPQTRHLRRELQRVREGGGRTGIGAKRGWLGPGAMVILVGDEERRIQEARVMSGRTIFARFRSMDEVVGAGVDDEPSPDRRSRAVDEAFNMALQNLRTAYRRPGKPRQAGQEEVHPGRGGGNGSVSMTGGERPSSGRRKGGE
jgi:DNA-binding transcriptional regulator of glucitol operon